MLKIPEGLTGADLAFGNVKHLPKYSTLPDDFRNMSHPACRAVSAWFFKGAEPYTGGIAIDGKNYKAKNGVAAIDALRAIRSCLCSFEPKHEHKIAGCGFMLNEWFEQPAEAALPSQQREAK